jgi:hypothetical protein
VQGQFPARGYKAKQDRDRHGEHDQAHGADLPGRSDWPGGRFRGPGQGWPQFGGVPFEGLARRSAHRRRLLAYLGGPMASN